MTARVPITMALLMGSLSKQDADELVDEYRAEVLNEAADTVDAGSPSGECDCCTGTAATLRRMATAGKASPTGVEATQPKPPFDPGVCTECGMRDTQWCPGCAACKCAGGCAPSCPTAVATCGRCRKPFDPTDTRFDGQAQQDDTAFCRRCVDRCHESEDAGHACPVCRPQGGEAR